jgi:hypothetical protein
MRKKPHMKEINELLIAMILNFLKKRNDISSGNQQSEMAEKAGIHPLPTT